ncbi:MAG: PD40 domain-containing protein [Acidobacteria bacterium]|nr:PD40 domain-containing protein [Acidobacteriota bacterium]
MQAHPGADIQPIWEPDGRHLLFSSDRGGEWRTWRVAVQAGRAVGGPQEASGPHGRLYPLGFTAAGAYYNRAQTGMLDVFTVRLSPGGGSEPVRVPASFSGTNMAPSWSPDGGSLACHSVRGAIGLRAAPRVITIRELATGEERFLRPPLAAGNATPRWSPDGAHLLVRGLDRANRFGIHAIDAHTGALVTSIQFSMNEQTVYGPSRWSPDGAIVYAHTGRGLVRRELATGAETIEFDLESLPVSWLPLQGFEYSPDGQSLAFTGPPKETNELTALYLRRAGGEVSELLRVSRPEMISLQAGCRTAARCCSPASTPRSGRRTRSGAFQPTAAPPNHSAWTSRGSPG